MPPAAGGAAGMPPNVIGTANAGTVTFTPGTPPQPPGTSVAKPAAAGATDGSLPAAADGAAVLGNGDGDGEGDCGPATVAGADAGVVGNAEARSESPLPRGEGKGCEPPLGS